MVKIDIMSDPVCPWCYIGKSMLDQALIERPDHPFVIQWHPFQLNPDMPPEGMDRIEYIEWKFGGKEGAVKAHVPMMEYAEKIGIPLNLGDIKRSPNTLDAHRLIHWAGLEGCQTAIVSALFKAYFVEGRDIGEHEVLADVADANGMDASVVLRLLKSDADATEVSNHAKSVRDMGISSVPTFVVDGKHAVPGAQPAELWLKVMDELAGVDS